MSSTPHYLGIDVCKRSLDLSPLPGFKLRSLLNSPAAMLHLVQILRALPYPVWVVCEATGGYQDLLVRMLIQAGIPVSVVNPRVVRAFAASLGLLAKNDRIDAQVLARFGLERKPRATEALSPDQLHLKCLLARKAQLQEDLLREESRQEHLTDPWVIAQARRSIKRLKAELLSLLNEVDRVVASSELLRPKVERLRQIKGIGRITAVSLIGTVPELGTLRRGQTGALCGLAPFCHDSGPYKGQRHIAHGRSPARHALYMAAMVASRHNPILRALYQRLIQRGKAPKLALVALMRRLAEAANLVLSQLPTSPSIAVP